MRKKKSKVKGKMSRIFQKLEEGDRVILSREISVNANFPLKFQGKSGVVVGKKGGAYIVKIRDNKKDKLFIVNPINLKKQKEK